MSWLQRLIGNQGAGSTTLGVRSIRFDSSGWKEKQATNDVVEWRNADGDVMRARFSEGAAPFLADTSDLVSLRERCRREAAASQGAIVSVEMVSIQGIPCVEVIRKLERRPAYAFEGVLAIGLEAGHYSLTIESVERGTTGVRDAVVTAHVFERGELELVKDPDGDGEKLEGWFLDPYLEGYEGPVLHSLSDDERLDPLFPEHPLSKVRVVLRRVEKTLTFDEAVRPSVLPVSGAVSTATQGADGARTDRARRPLSALTVGTLFARAGRAGEAMAMLTEALQEAEKGGAGTEIADATMEMGRLQLKLGHPGMAKAMLRRAAGLRAGSGRSRIREQALLLLGLACEDEGSFGEAETVLREARTSLDPAGPEDPLRAQVTLGLGRVCISQHKADEAEPFFKEALRQFEKEGPQAASSAAVALNGLGLVQNERGRYPVAIQLFEKALASFQSAHGPDYPDVATVLENMAYSWHMLGREEKARELLVRAARVGRH